MMTSRSIIRVLCSVANHTIVTPALIFSTIFQHPVERSGPPQIVLPNLLGTNIKAPVAVLSGFAHAATEWSHINYKKMNFSYYQIIVSCYPPKWTHRSPRAARSSRRNGRSISYHEKAKSNSVRHYNKKNTRFSLCEGGSIVVQARSALQLSFCIAIISDCWKKCSIVVVVVILLCCLV